MAAGVEGMTAVSPKSYPLLPATSLGPTVIDGSQFKEASEQRSHEGIASNLLITSFFQRSSVSQVRRVRQDPTSVPPTVIELILRQACLVVQK